jgi:agmatine deiminase
MMAVLTTEMQRNPGLTQAQLEKEYKRVLGVTNFVWLQRGVVDDNIPTERSWIGPDGQPDAYAMGAEHIDEFARFASPNTILLAEVSAQEAAQSPIAAETRKRLENNYQILKASKDQDGKKFTIIRVPAAETMFYRLDQNDGLYQWVSSMTFDDGSSVPAWPAPVYDIAATSYMNFVVTNGAVIVQQYWKAGLPNAIKQKDQPALQIIGSAFSGRQVVGISAYDLDINSGGIHCATQEEPAAN